MQLKKIKIWKPIGFLSGLLILLIVLSPFFMIHRDYYAKGYLKDNLYNKGILSEPKNTMDYLVIGDSESYSSILPMEIWKNYGYAGYNCGIPGQPLSDTYYLLQELLQKQSPKVIIMETNEFYRYIKIFDVFEKIANNFAEDHLPIYKYHDRWKELFAKPVYLQFNPFKGSNYNIAFGPYTQGVYVNKTATTTKIGIIPLFYLNKIVSLCKERHIQLILYSVPSPVNWTYAKHNGIVAFAQKKGLPFIDLNLYTNELGIDWAKDTCDKGDHVNFYGAKKVTNYIGAYLSKNANLTDHRQEKGYGFWNKTLNEYLKQTSQK